MQLVQDGYQIQTALVTNCFIVSRARMNILSERFLCFLSSHIGSSNRVD